MQNSFTSSSNRPGAFRLAFIKALGFFLFFMSFSSLAILGLYYLQIDSYPALRKLVPRYRPPGRTVTIGKFRELEEASPVDILVVGSSHAYRGFDPRIFAKKNLSMHNLGTTAQTPLNSYFMLKKYIHQLKPKLVIVEIFVGTLISKDGLESFYDLAGNSDDFFWSLEMALATHSPLAFRYLVVNYADRILRRPLNSYASKFSEGEVYIPGGYVETFGHKTIVASQSREISLEDIQLKYLNKIENLVSDYGAQVLFVTAPMPEVTIKRYANYSEFSNDILKWAESKSARYLDFNIIARPFPDRMFIDWHHMNAYGVKKFNKLLLNTLIRGSSNPFS